MPIRRPRAVALLGTALVTTAVITTGCTLGESSTFRGRANDACAQVTRSVTNYRAPLTPGDALKYAGDRYTNVERLVSEITEDIARPGGSTGRALDEGWFTPARASLKQGRDDLEALRQVARRDDSSAMPAAFLKALAAGTSGVNVALLRREGLARCAITFTTPTAVPTA